MSIPEIDQDCGGLCDCCDGECGECCCCTKTCPTAQGRGFCMACGWYPQGED